MSLDDHMKHLLRAERLDDIGRLLRKRSWDEVPLYSRNENISFLNDLGVAEASRILVTYAVNYLENIFEFAKSRDRKDIVMMVSVLGWDDFEAVPPEPLRPQFWICTDSPKELVRFRIQTRNSNETNLVRKWLMSSRLERDYVVLENSVAEKDKALFRVYIAKVGDENIKKLMI